MDEYGLLFDRIEGDDEDLLDGYNRLDPDDKGDVPSGLLHVIKNREGLFLEAAI